MLRVVDRADALSNSVKSKRIVVAERIGVACGGEVRRMLFRALRVSASKGMACDCGGQDGLSARLVHAEVRAIMELV